MSEHGRKGVDCLRQSLHRQSGCFLHEMPCAFRKVIHTFREFSAPQISCNLIHRCDSGFRSLFHRGFKFFIDLYTKPFQTTAENRHLPLEVVHLHICHILHGTAAARNGCRKIIKLRTTTRKHCLRTFQIYFIENIVQYVCFFLLTQALHCSVQLFEGFIQRIQIPFRVKCRHTKAFQRCRRFICRCG